MEQLETALAIGALVSQVESLNANMVDMRAEMRSKLDPLLVDRAVDRERILALVKKQELIEKSVKDTADELEKIQASKAKVAGFLAGIGAVSSGIGAAVAKLWSGP